MNKLAFSVLFIALTTGAQARPATSALTCAAARELVRAQGAVVFDTSPTTFDRYVRDASFCPGRPGLQPGWAPTRDQAQCMIGYTCGAPVVRPFARN
jgi:hypothetical protein